MQMRCKSITPTLYTDLYTFEEIYCKSLICLFVLMQAPKHPKLPRYQAALYPDSTSGPSWPAAIRYTLPAMPASEAGIPGPRPEPPSGAVSTQPEHGMRDLVVGRDRACGR